MRIHLALITILFILYFENGFSQSITGTRGIVKAPSARMYTDGTLIIGTSFIPPGYHKRTYGSLKGRVTGNAGLNTFITVNIFPFMEIMFRYTHEFNVEVTPLSRYFPDRMLSARFKILEETKKLPAIVLGLQDITGALGFDQGGSPNFAATYIVGSKSFDYKGLQIDTSLGYGLNEFRQTGLKEFNGLFGGIDLTTPYTSDIHFLIDYDSQFLNLGIQKFFLNRIHTVINYYPKFSKVGFIIAYRYKI
jgi:hypothetical protein